MGQNITWLGASYTGVEQIELPQTGGGTVTFYEGGSSKTSWTKVCETTYTISYSSTNAASHATWATGHSEIWTSNKILYIRIRDTAGKRAGYFYGTDVFFMNMYPVNESTATSASSGMIMNFWSYSSSNTFSQRYGYSTTGYGVYPNLIYQNGNIRIGKRYNSTYSRTIDGTYKIEVYLLDPAGGILPFA